MSFEPAISVEQRRSAIPVTRGTSPSRSKRITLADFIWPLVVIASLTLLVLTMGVHFSVRAFDRQNVAHEQALARNGIAQRIEEVALLAIPQTMWDDAVANLDNRFDHGWADANIGKYLAQVAGFDSSFVLRADGGIAYAAVDGKVVPASDYAKVAATAAPLLKTVRSLEAARGPLRKASTNAMIAAPIQANALHMVDGGMVVVTATLVQPDFGTALPRATGAPIVVTTMKIDPHFLEQFARRYQLEGLHLLRLDQAALPGEISIAMRDHQKQRIAELAWTPANPGYRLLRHSLPPVVAAFVLLSVVALLMLRHITRAASALIQAERESHEIAFHDHVSGLPNEHHFLRELADQIAEAGPAYPIAVHIVEYDAGSNEPIVQAASAALAAQCARDSFVARLSDARFGIISPGMTAPQAIGLASRLEAPLEILLPSQEILTLTGHIGFTVAEGPIDALDMMRDAEPTRA